MSLSDKELNEVFFQKHHELINRFNEMCDNLTGDSEYMVIILEKLGWQALNVHEEALRTASKIKNKPASR